ncbi:MAG TPA: Gfo/Idh/MocA family oxidoreductase [Verrucomicrobiae bacterium]|nr:Gfo/Idh/MocA family oxidoreductase [Verrucomicrobiae bacterium]
MKLTRREFSRLLALGAGAELLPKIPALADDRPIGYCIVGLGRISMQHFMPAVRMSKKSRVTALVSGHRDKAEHMAAEYGVPGDSIYSYEDYDDIAKNPNIDAVYIALPNSMHAEYTIRAAKAGKHVLCEKPMATSVEDSRSMIQACQSANRKLMIAYRCQYEPVHLRAVEMIREGKIGSIESIESAFGFAIAPNEWRLDKKLSGGGPLVDVGIYCLNASRYLIGEEPVEVKGISSVVDHDGRFAQVEETLSWTARFPNGALANCNCTYGSAMRGYFRVRGSRGTITVDPAFNYDKLHLSAEFDGGGTTEFAPDEPDPVQFLREADHMADCILQNSEPKTPGQEGLRDMEWIAQIYRSCEKSNG